MANWNNRTALESAVFQISSINPGKALGAYDGLFGSSVAYDKIFKRLGPHDVLQQLYTGVLPPVSSSNPVSRKLNANLDVMSRKLNANLDVMSRKLNVPVLRKLNANLDAFSQAICVDPAIVRAFSRSSVAKMPISVVDWAPKFWGLHPSIFRDLENAVNTVYESESAFSDLLQQTVDSCTQEDHPEDADDRKSATNWLLETLGHLLARIAEQAPNKRAILHFIVSTIIVPYLLCLYQNEQSAIPVEKVNQIYELFVEHLKQDEIARKHYLTRCETPVKAKPTTSARKLASLEANTPVKFVKRKGKRIQVVFEDVTEGEQKTGWVLKKHLELLIDLSTLEEEDSASDDPIEDRESSETDM